MVPSTPPSKGATPKPIPTKPISCQGRACRRTYVRTVWQQEVLPLVEHTMGKAAAQPWARHRRRLAISPPSWASTSTRFRAVLHGRGQHTSHRRLPRLPESTRRSCTKKTQSRPTAPSGARRYLHMYSPSMMTCLVATPPSLMEKTITDLNRHKQQKGGSPTTSKTTTERGANENKGWD